MSAVALGLALMTALVLCVGPALLESVAATSNLRNLLASADGVTMQRSGIADVAGFDAFEVQAQHRVGGGLGRYLDSGEQVGAAPSLPLTSAGGRPAARAEVRAAYLSELAGHVEVVQGELAGDGSDSLMGAVSMPIDDAARAGLDLGNTICLGAGQADAGPWCARIVGLWRPRNAAEPYWSWEALRTSAIVVMANRSDFFTLLDHLAPEAFAGITTGRRYWPRGAAIAPGDAADLARRVHHLRAGAGADLTIVSTLDAGLDDYEARWRIADRHIQVLTAALAVLSITLVGVLGGRFLERRRREVGVLRARGWSAGRVGRLALLEIGVVAAIVLGAAGVVAGLLWVILGGGTVGSPLSGVGHDRLLRIGVAVGVAFTAIAVWLGAHAVATGRRLEPGPLSSPAGSPARRRWRWSQPTSLLEITQASSGVTGSAAILPVWAAPPGQVVSSVTTLIGRWRTSVEWTLARRRVINWWRENPPVGFLLAFGIAVAAFAATALAHLIVDGNARTAIGGGLTAGMGLGFLGAIFATVITHLFVFVFAFGARAEDHAALILDGLPPRTLSRSLAIERQLLLGTSLLLGLGLGLILIWGVGSGLGVAVAWGLSTTAALVLAGGMGAGWLMRRGSIPCP